MTDILKIQRQFSDHIYKQNDKKIFAHLPYSDKEAQARLNIYRNNVFGNFSSVLSSIFEVIKKLVGDDYFQQLCDEYNQKYFSRSGNLDNYGDAFPKFLNDVKAKHKLPYLADVAKLELLFHAAYYCADAKKFDIEKFKKIDQQKFFDMEFELHPSCFLFASEFPIYSIWIDNIEETSQKKIALNYPEFVLVERSSNRVIIHNLSKEEFIFLANITRKTLYKTYLEIRRQTKKDCDIGALLNKFISLGIINNFKISAKNELRKNKKTN